MKPLFWIIVTDLAAVELGSQCDNQSKSQECLIIISNGNRTMKLLLAATHLRNNT